MAKFELPKGTKMTLNKLTEIERDVNGLYFVNQRQKYAKITYVANEIDIESDDATDMYRLYHTAKIGNKTNRYQVGFIQILKFKF